MINVYYGGSNRDKDRFMFDMIKRQMPANTVLLVPDQFTLQAERNAFEYMNVDALLELEIMSRSGFARRVEAQVGAPHGTVVDKYGRYMLLTKLILEMGSEGEAEGTLPHEESIFAGVKKKRSFITMLNDQISEFKQYNITWQELNEMAEKFADDEILGAKLSEICEVYQKYEQATEGVFTDAEDHQQVINERIKDASFVKRSIFWIDGFDYMTPKLMSMVEAIAQNAVDVNIVLTGEKDGGDSAAGSGAAARGIQAASCLRPDGRAGREIFNIKSIPALIAEGSRDFFEISRNMRRRLRECAERCGIRYHEEEIGSEYELMLRPKVTLMSASDFYCEAESIAIEISKLVREKGYRYKEIVIICNDADKRGSVFRRVFGRYGIPLFIDRKRSITHEPAVEFITAMLDIIRKKRRFDDVFRMLKTGFGPVSDDECEVLEKYCRKYNIRSGRWKKDFVYGVKDEGEERLAALNDIRRRVDEFITSAERLFDGKKTARERCEALYLFLVEKAAIPERCASAAEVLSGGSISGELMLEAAESISQVWESIVKILDQFVEVLGDEIMSDDDFNEILSEGFDEFEIGLIPTNNDQVIFGTMQRTRTGRARVMFVAGVNDGVLPESGRTESLLSDSEKQLITEKIKRISKTDELRVMEQNLAVYKNLTKVSDYLCVSYAELDTDGAELRPSEIVEDMRRLAGALETADASEKNSQDSAGVINICRDYISMGDVDSMLQSEEAASGHVTSALRAYLNGGALDDEWKAAALALDGKKCFDKPKKGLFYSSDVERIKRKHVKELFGRGRSGDLILSASGLERYSRCPFSFFITYGLKPEEERRFQADMRSIGDIYHESMRRVADELTQEGVEISAPESLWLKVSREECREMTARYVDEFAERYREGLFKITGREAYIRERIKEICFETAWLMIEQVRRGSVKAIYFEQRFARRADAVFPPIEIDLGDEGSVFIEGIIDRIDIINGWENVCNYIRIIDYKSGSEKFDLNEVKSGWRLQLMLYLKGAMGAIENSRPAGVFYFAVKEPRIDVTSVPDDSINETVASSMLKSVCLDGALVDNESVIMGMDNNINGSSEVIPVRRLQSGVLKGGALLSDAEFDELIKTNDENLRAAAGNFASGCIDADPKSGKSTDACKYCAYHSICGHE